MPEAKALIARAVKGGLQVDFDLYLPILVLLQKQRQFAAIRTLLAEMEELKVVPDRQVRRKIDFSLGCSL